MVMLVKRLSRLDGIAIYTARNRLLIQAQVQNIRTARLQMTDSTQSVALLRSLLVTRRLLRRHREVLKFNLQYELRHQRELRSGTAE